MTISRIACVVAFCLFVCASAVVVNAQILNASMPSSPEGVQTAVGGEEAESEHRGFLPVSWPSISMPSITMPKVSMPKWPTHPDGAYYSPLTPITAGASKVSAGTKKVWVGTKEMFSFGAEEEVAQPGLPAASHPQPTFWQRMTGQEPEPTGPQTVAEWMSQPRLDP